MVSVPVRALLNGEVVPLDGQADVEDYVRIVGGDQRGREGSEGLVGGGNGNGMSYEADGGIGGQGGGQGGGYGEGRVNGDILEGPKARDKDGGGLGRQVFRGGHLEIKEKEVNFSL